MSHILYKTSTTLNCTQPVSSCLGGKRDSFGGGARQWWGRGEPWRMVGLGAARVAGVLIASHDFNLDVNLVPATRHIITAQPLSISAISLDVLMRKP